MSVHFHLDNIFSIYQSNEYLLNKKSIYTLNFLSNGTQGVNTPNSFRVLTVRDSLNPVITTTLRRNSRLA